MGVPDVSATNGEPCIPPNNGFKHGSGASCMKKNRLGGIICLIRIPGFEQFLYKQPLRFNENQKACCSSRCNLFFSFLSASRLTKS
jgi:hypothetical protein